MADEVARLVAVMEANLKGFTKGMEQAQRIADQRFGQIEKRMQKSEQRFAKGFGNLNVGKTLLAGGAIIGIERYVTTITRAAGEIKDTADVLKVGTDELQAWGILALQNSVSQEQFNTSLEKFGKNLGNAALKGGDARKQFQNLGIDIRGNLTKGFYQLADAVAATKDPQQQVAIVTAMLGKGAAKLTPIMAQGSHALKAYVADLKASGKIMSSDVIAKIDDMGDKWEVLKRQLVTTGGNTLAGFFDGFSQFAGQVESPAFQAALQNFGKIMGEIAGYVAKAAPYLPAIAGAWTASKLARPFGPVASGVAAVGGAMLAQSAADGNSREGLDRRIARIEADIKRNPGWKGTAYAKSLDRLKAQRAAMGAAPAATAAPPPVTPEGTLDRGGAFDESAAKRKAAGLAKLADAARDQAKDLREVSQMAAEDERESILGQNEARRDNVRAQDDALLQMAQGTSEFYDLQRAIIQELARLDIGSLEDRRDAELATLKDRAQAQSQALDDERETTKRHLDEMVEQEEITRDQANTAIKDKDANIAAQRAEIAKSLAARRVQAEAEAAGQIANVNQKLAADLAQADEDEHQTKQTLIDLTTGLRDGFMDVGSAALHGFGAVEDAAGRALQQIADMILQMYVLKPLMEGLLGPSGTAGGGLLGGAIKGVSNFFAGFFADGGTIGAGQWGIVGEAGPERVRAKPGGGIEVEPNSALRRVAMPSTAAAAPRAGGVVVEQHFDLRGAVVTEKLYDDMNRIAGERSQQAVAVYDRAVIPKRVRKLVTDRRAS